VADVERPALAEVLSAITDRPVGHWRAEVASPAFARIERISPRDVQWTVQTDRYRATTQTRRANLRSTEPACEARRVDNTLTRVEVAPAHTITPAEAAEMLYERGLWPWEPGEARWWCERCQGCGWLPGWRHCACVGGSERYGHTPDPPTLPALVAVASLGASSLVTAVELAGVLAPGAVVAWRVMTREAIEAHHRAHHTATAWLTSTPTPTEIFACEEVLRLEGGPFWQSACDWGYSAARAAWPALRALAVGEGPTPQPTGVHLVALDAVRIVLAVEAIGGDRG
jgi:hypothetical protein